MLPAGSTVFLLILCVLQFLCLKRMEIEEENNAAGAVAHGIFGQCRVILSVKLSTAAAELFCLVTDQK